jgi:hypothetical protein
MALGLVIAMIFFEHRSPGCENFNVIDGLRKTKGVKGSANIIRIDHDIIGPMAAARGSDLLQDTSGAQGSEIDHRNSSEHPARCKHLVTPFLEHPIVAPLQNADYQVIVFSRELWLTS